MNESEDRWGEIDAEIEKVGGFFNSLPEEMRADAAEKLIIAIVTWGSRDHYQSLGIFMEALLWYRGESLRVHEEEEGAE